MKTKSPKLSKETLIKIWQASRPNIYKNKKKYTKNVIGYMTQHEKN